MVKYIYRYCLVVRLYGLYGSQPVSVAAQLSVTTVGSSVHELYCISKRNCLKKKYYYDSI